MAIFIQPVRSELMQLNNGRVYYIIRVNYISKIITHIISTERNNQTFICNLISIILYFGSILEKENIFQNEKNYVELGVISSV